MSMTGEDLDVVGESSLIYMSLLPEIAALVDPFKVVVMQRDRAELEESWLRWLQRWQYNPFSRPYGAGVGGRVTADGQMYPALNASGLRDGIQKYLDWCEQRQQLIVENTNAMVFDLRFANSEQRVNELLDWVGCSRKGRNLDLVGVLVNHC